MLAGAASIATQEPPSETSAEASEFFELTGDAPRLILDIELEAADGVPLRGTKQADLHIGARGEGGAYFDPEARPAATATLEALDGTPAPDAFELDANGDGSFTPFASCDIGPCAERYRLTIDVARSSRKAYPMILVMLTVNVRFGAPYDMTYVDAIRATVRLSEP